MAIAKDEQILKSNCPNVVVGTPGRILALVRSKKLNLKNIKHFILDECDKMLEQLGKSMNSFQKLSNSVMTKIGTNDSRDFLIVDSDPNFLVRKKTKNWLNRANFWFVYFSDMRRDVQEIFRATPHEKQVMMFSATLSKEIRPVCKKFMQDVNKSSFTITSSSTTLASLAVSPTLSCCG